MIQMVSPFDANDMVCGRDELAFFDVRELGPYSEGHPLFAGSLPYSLLETRVRRLAPRLTVPVLLIDGSDGLAAVAAERLQEVGYTDVSVVKGGAAAWQGNGLELFEGVNVPSKTLGELAHLRWKPEFVTPDQFAGWVAEGKDFGFVDCRPGREYSVATVPGASNLPVGELLCRIRGFSQDASIVLTCAGRTRGIVAACTLGLMDKGRRYFVLENGTQGWVLSGRRLARGLKPSDAVRLAPADRESVRARAKDFLLRFGIPQVDAEVAAGFREDCDRTTYFYDTRPPEQSIKSRLAGFARVSAGQLVQQTDAFVGVLRARIVLADDLGLRAAFAAFWLSALGHEVYVVETGNQPGKVCQVEFAEPRIPRCKEVEASIALAQAGAGTATILDCRESREYSECRVSGSVWSSRPLADELDRRRRWLVTDGGGGRAALMCKELGRIGVKDYAKVVGGVSALFLAGAQPESGRYIPAEKAVDFPSFADGRHDGNLVASRTYLDWELGLPSRLSAAERSMFAV